MRNQHPTYTDLHRLLFVTLPVEKARLHWLIRCIPLQHKEKIRFCEHKYLNEKDLYMRKLFMLYFPISIIALYLMLFVPMDLLRQSATPPLPSTSEPINSAMPDDDMNLDSVNPIDIQVDFIEPVDDVETPPPPKDSISLSVVGDVMMDSVIGDYIRKYGVDYSWADVSSELSRSDLAIANLETSVSTRGSTLKPQGYGFRSQPLTLKGLSNSGIDLVSLANNHSLDFGTDALFDTLDALDENGIAYTGAGRNRQVAEKLVILQRNGLNIGFLSYTSIIPHKSWIAQDTIPGIAPLVPDQYDRILQHIEASDAQCDILIVLLHWGIEHSDQVEPWQQQLAQKMIGHGADAIVGHHPHVLRGIAFYRNKPIIYSTGNFIFLKRDEKAGRSAIFTMELNREGFVRGNIQPIHIQYGKANLLQKNNPLRQKIIDDIHKLSIPLGTTFTPDGEFFLQE